MKKRGQLLGQPFIMVFALVVGALILAWGVYEAYKLVKLAKDVEVSDYINTLSKDVQRYYYFEPGSSNKFTISLPSEFTHICFVSRDIPFFCNKGSIPCVKPQNYNYGFVVSRKSDNIFIFSPSKKEILAYYVPYLRPTATENPLCVANDNMVVLTSRGSYVEVSNV